MPESFSLTVAGLGLGFALSGTPGPVQAILLAETLRGGTARGLRAMAGAITTFGALLVGLALGLAFVAPGEAVVRILKVVGGLFLVWLAIDGFRAHETIAPIPADARATLPPAARGALAVLLNPGAWLFMATAASSLMTAASQLSGRGGALAAALALLAGVAAGDGLVVLGAGLGLRRASAGTGRRLQRVLALVLAGLGLWFISGAIFA